MPVGSKNPEILIVSPKALIYTKHGIASAYLNAPFDLQPYAAAYRLWVRSQIVATERSFYALEREGDDFLRDFNLDTIIWLAIRASKEVLAKKWDPETRREAACREQLLALGRRKMARKESAEEKDPIILQALYEALYTVIVDGGGMEDFADKKMNCCSEWIVCRTFVVILLNSIRKLEGANNYRNQF